MIVLSMRSSRETTGRETLLLRFLPWRALAKAAYSSRTEDCFEADCFVARRSELAAWLWFL